MAGGPRKVAQRAGGGGLAGLQARAGFQGSSRGHYRRIDLVGNGENGVSRTVCSVGETPSRCLQTSNTIVIHDAENGSRQSCTEPVESVPRPLERVDNIEGSDSLALCVLCVRNRVANDLQQRMIMNYGYESSTRTDAHFQGRS